MRSDWRTLRDSVLSYPTSAPTLLEWPCREQRGFLLTLPVSLSPPYTNELWPLLWPVSVTQRNRPLNMFCTIQSIWPLSNVWPDGSGWRDNRIAAQHWARDLVQRSSRLEELATNMKETRSNMCLVLKCRETSGCKRYTIPCNFLCSTSGTFASVELWFHL